MAQAEPGGELARLMMGKASLTGKRECRSQKRWHQRPSLGLAKGPYFSPAGPSPLATYNGLEVPEVGPTGRVYRRETKETSDHQLISPLGKEDPF